MNTDDIAGRVLALLAAALKQPVDEHTRRDQVAAWDSLKHIELVFAIEDELDIAFDEAELAGIDGAPRLIELATRKKACATA